MRPRQKPLNDTVLEVPKDFDERLNQAILRGLEQAKLEAQQWRKERGLPPEPIDNQDSGTD